MALTSKIEIRRLRKSDIEEVVSLIDRTYRRFNGRESTPSATKRYAGLYDLRRKRDNIEEKFLGATVCLVAVDGTEVVGVLRCQEEWVRNLFVDGRYHRQGIGSRLMEECERTCRRRGLQALKLNSTLFALPFYQVRGYKKMTGVQRREGLAYQPMKKSLTD
jgi:GNAT superfamily N-acetyltransferase